MKKLFFLGLMIFGNIKSAELLEHFPVNYSSYDEFMDHSDNKSIGGTVKTLQNFIEKERSTVENCIRSKNQCIIGSYYEAMADVRVHNRTAYYFYLKNRLVEAERDYYKALSIKLQTEINRIKSDNAVLCDSKTNEK